MTFFIKTFSRHSKTLQDFFRQDVFSKRFKTFFQDIFQDFFSSYCFIQFKTFFKIILFKNFFFKTFSKTLFKWGTPTSALGAMPSPRDILQDTGATVYIWKFIKVKS